MHLSFFLNNELIFQNTPIEELNNIFVKINKMDDA